MTTAVEFKFGLGQRVKSENDYWKILSCCHAQDGNYYIVKGEKRVFDSYIRDEIKESELEAIEGEIGDQ